MEIASASSAPPSSRAECTQVNAQGPLTGLRKRVPKGRHPCPLCATTASGSVKDRLVDVHTDKRNSTKSKTVP